MQVTNRSLTGFAATGIATAGIAALVAAPLAPPPAVMSSPATHEVRLAAAAVPPGGLITSFLGNQVIYCSLICPYLVQGAVTVPVAVLQSPFTLVAALQSGDPIKAIGAAAASVTGAAAAAAIPIFVVDGAVVVPRALNALEVAVVGVLSIGSAATGGLPGLVTAIETARQDTFDALNRQPIAPNVPPTVQPHGVLQVAVVEGLNVVAAVVVPGLYDVLIGGLQSANVAAQTLASTGDPAMAVAAGVATASAALNDARNVVADAVDTAVTHIRAAIDESHPAAASTNVQFQQQKPSVVPTRAKLGTPKRLAGLNSLTALNKLTTLDKPATADEPVSAKPQSARPVREAVSKLRDRVRDAVKSAAERPHRTKSSAT